MASAVAKKWARIMKWYEKNLPAGVFTFAPGASSDAIRKVEKHLGVEFPNEVQQSYLTCNGLHNCGLSYFGYFNSLDEIVSQWEQWLDYEKAGFDWPQPWDDPSDPSIKRVYWNRLRIPLATNYDGNYVFLDLDPVEPGKVGQIIFLRRLLGPTTKLANSLNLWLGQFANDLEGDKYLYDADAESLIPEDQW